MVANKLLANERVIRDFPERKENPELTDGDQVSVVSGLESEIDEWAALNKFALLKEHHDEKSKAEKIKAQKERMRQELIKQQQEFLERKDEYKKDLDKYFREQKERNEREDILAAKKKVETEKQIQEINKWRIEHAKLKQQRLNAENKTRIRQELESLERNEQAQDKEAFEVDRKKKSQLQVLRHAIIEQQIYKNKVSTQTLSLKDVDKKVALAAETATDWETVKRVAEQERRREEVRLREDLYASQESIYGPEY